MSYLQGIFITFWSIWTYRNLVVHEGKHPNPLEVVLTAQSLICRFKEAFSSCSVVTYKPLDQQGRFQFPQKYEARNMQGEVILQRVSSCTENMGALIILDAMVEAAVKARSLGFKFLLFLIDILRPVLVSNRMCRPNWQERILVDDLYNLAQFNVVCHSVFVPKLVIGNVSFLAKLATDMPINHCMV